MSFFPQFLVGWYKNTQHLLISVWETVKAGYSATKLTVVGVTGTDGKTTTVHLIYEILKAAGYPSAAVSSLGAFVKPPAHSADSGSARADEFQDTGFHTTTPDATVLQPFLHKLVDQGITHVVLEVTSHGLDQHRVLGCNFKVGVLTNVTHEHLDYHKTLEKYRAVKAKLFRGVKIAVLNRDDASFEYVRTVRTKINPNAKIITYSLATGSTLLASGMKTDQNATNFVIHERGKKYSITTKLVGRYNISNVLAAVGAGRALSIEWKTIQEAIKDFSGVPGRMEVIQSQPFTVIVDFAHTPNSLQELLTSLERSLLSRQGGKLITVFGCAGERDNAKRPMMGEISALLADISIFTAEDPRSENVDKIIGQMMVGAQRVGATEAKPRGVNLFRPWGGIIPTPREAHTKHLFVQEPDRRRAVRLAVNIARTGDIIAILGKGHEKSMAYGKTEIPWSDQEEAKKALKITQAQLVSHKK